MSDPNEPQQFNRNLIAEYRANGGKVTGIFANAPLLLLTTTGARSGRPRTSPLVYTTDGDRLVVIASKGGAPTNPDWYHNLLAHPKVTAEIGTGTVELIARMARDDEREPIWTAQKAAYPGFADYEQKTTRQIPVIILEPVR